MDVEIVITEDPVPLGIRETVVGLRLVAGPPLRMGETVAVKPTSPAKPPRLVRVMIAVEDAPLATVIDVRLVLTPKSV